MHQSKALRLEPRPSRECHEVQKGVGGIDETGATSVGERVGRCPHEGAQIAMPCLPTAALRDADPSPFQRDVRRIGHDQIGCADDLWKTPEAIGEIEPHDAPARREPVSGEIRRGKLDQSRLTFDEQEGAGSSEVLQRERDRADTSAEIQCEPSGPSSHRERREQEGVHIGSVAMAARRLNEHDRAFEQRVLGDGSPSHHGVLLSAIRWRAPGMAGARAR